MWPGQQPPGGENPQQPNPYQQGQQQPNPYQRPGQQPPGPYQQPNPYHQPGFQQPNPYTQPTVARPMATAAPGGPGGGGGRGRTALVAIVAATAVVAAAVITATVVLRDNGTGGDTDGKAPAANASDQDGTSTSVPPSPADGAAGAPSSPAENPRGTEDVEPTIPGWKVVTNPKHGTRFDVPPQWTVAGAGISTFLEDEKKGGGVPLVTMSAPAHLKPRWCIDDSGGLTRTSGLATAGTKGGKGAKDTRTAAYNEAGVWAWGAFAQKEPKGTVSITPAKPYTTASGLRGSRATATADGVRKKSKCASDGKSVAFTFKDATGEFRTWVLYAAAGVPDEVPDATIDRVLSTLRAVGKPAG
ncbi:hypothetical protein [Streptomyces sp. NPDC001985]|uniref:hypothetical protein n=1 Tax=Streptomyces sp. NPDC001985 TaxID=3154406 RepID=UPI00332B1C03